MATAGTPPNAYTSTHPATRIEPAPHQVTANGAQRVESDKSGHDLETGGRHRHGQNLGSRFKTATASGVKIKHLRALTVLGRIGWCAKGIVYGLIGGLCCRGAISEKVKDTSPQGAFVLLGSGATGAYVLIVMAAALATYIIWRFWEAITGQGRHECYSKFKNFFTFRLSPFVSGGVYCAYLAYILYLIPKAFQYKNNAVEDVQGSDFTASWRGSGLGRTGLFFVGLAFLIAFIIMALQALTKKFHRELRLKELRTWSKWLVLVAGHVGAVGRAALFMGVAILMFRAMGDDEPQKGAEAKQNTLSKALADLVTSRGGRAVLFIIGFLLVVYCLFAVLNAYPAKIFPTPLPSEAEQRRMIEKRKHKEEGRQGRKQTVRDRYDILRDNFVEVIDLPGSRSSVTNGDPRAVSSPQMDASTNGSKHSATVMPTGRSHAVGTPYHGVAQHTAV